MTHGSLLAVFMFRLPKLCALELAFTDERVATFVLRKVAAVFWPVQAHLW